MKTLETVRTKFARLLRALFTGRITNDEFEDEAMSLRQNDHAVAEVFVLGVWGSYSDLSEYRMVGLDALSREGRRHVARWILFLKTNQPYSWPPYPHFSTWSFVGASLAAVVIGSHLHGWSGAFLSLYLILFALLYADNFYGNWKWRKIYPKENLEVWPFASKRDFESALKNPPYFRGASRQ